MSSDYPDELIDVGYSRTVSYVNQNHFSLIRQKWGSVHRKVMPFCVANVLVTLILLGFLHNGIDLTVSEFGHEFMSVLVAFLVTGKLSFTLSLYYELQGYLAKMNQSSVELTQLACSFTSGNRQKEYQDWRFHVTQQVLILLKAAVFVVYEGGKHHVWGMEELQEDPPQLFMKGDRRRDSVNAGNTASRRFSFLRSRRRPSYWENRKNEVPKELYVWRMNLPSDKNLRTPIRVAQRLREAIMAHRLLPQDPLDSIREQQLLQCVKEFMDSYYSIRKYLTCPLPLPYVQLSRIFVLFYIFTLPFALLNPGLDLKYFQMIILIYLMTYGFMGIELLYVEIDYPFGEDPNDLPLMEEARAAGEDIYLSLWHVDGKEAAERLKTKFCDFAPQQHRDFAPQHHGDPNNVAKETDPLV